MRNSRAFQARGVVCFVLKTMSTNESCRQEGNDGGSEETIETQLRSALDSENEEEARELAAELWADRDVTSVEVLDSGDGGAVEVSKDGLYGSFSVALDRAGYPRASETGFVVYEQHDDDGYYLIEEVEVQASAKVLDRMNEALDASVKRTQERKARRKEYRRMAL